MRQVLLALSTALCLGLPAATAQETQDVDVTIDTLLGDPAAFHAAFDAVKQAVADGDSLALAEYIPYGTPINIHGEQRVFESEHDFSAAYDQVITPEIVAVVAAQEWKTLFVNAEGVMFGAGEVWLNGLCTDEACSSFDVRITAIQTMPD